MKNLKIQGLLNETANPKLQPGDAARASTDLGNESGFRAAMDNIAKRTQSGQDVPTKKETTNTVTKKNNVNETIGKLREKHQSEMQDKGETPKAESGENTEAASMVVTPQAILKQVETPVEAEDGSANEAQAINPDFVGKTGEDNAVDVLEGLSLQKGNEDGIETVDGMETFQMPDGKETQTDDTKAWMPNGSIESEPAPAPQNTGEQVQDITQEIETRLEEHLRPLENDNGFLEPSKSVNDLDMEVHIEVEDVADGEEPTLEQTGDKQVNAAQEETIDTVETAKPSQGDAETAGEETDDSKQQNTATPPKTETVIKTDSPMVAPKVETIAQPQQQVIQPAETVQESFFSRMVDNITTNANNGVREFSIDLAPEFIGEMHISLVMGEEGLTAKIKTADSGVNSLISQHLFKLEESLKQQGIDVVDLEVSVFDTGDFKGNFDSQNGANFENGESSQQVRIPKVAQARAAVQSQIESLDTAQSVDMTSMGSSVEYSA